MISEYAFLLGCRRLVNHICRCSSPMEPIFWRTVESAVSGMIHSMNKSISLNPRSWWLVISCNHRHLLNSSQGLGQTVVCFWCTFRGCRTLGSPPPCRYQPCWDLNVELMVGEKNVTTFGIHTCPYMHKCIHTYKYLFSKGCLNLKKKRKTNAIRGENNRI